MCVCVNIETEESLQKVQCTCMHINLSHRRHCTNTPTFYGAARTKGTAFLSDSRGGSAIFSVVRPRKWLCSHTFKSPLHNNKSFLQYLHNILKFTACVVRLYRLARACYHSLYQAIPFFARNDLYLLYHALFMCNTN